MITFSQSGLNDAAGGLNSHVSHSVLHFSVKNTFLSFASKREVSSMICIFEELLSNPCISSYISK